MFPSLLPVLTFGDNQELRMRLGSKKIYHLEAWVVKVMCLYKVCTIAYFCFEYCWLTGNLSTLPTTLICLNSTS